MPFQRNAGRRSGQRCLAQARRGSTAGAPREYAGSTAGAPREAASEWHRLGAGGIGEIGAGAALNTSLTHLDVSHNAIGARFGVVLASNLLCARNFINVQRTTDNMQRATCTVQRTACSMQRTTCNVVAVLAHSS